MANLFKNPLVVAESVVGSLLDTRPLIMYKQPTGDLNQILSANNLFPINGDNVSPLNALSTIIENTQLTELFTGVGIPYLSQLNGFNMYGISYLSGEVNITSDLCQHPVETGEVITDNSIINPIAATVRIIMPTALYSRVYAEIEKFFKEKTYIILQTKLGTYANMVLTAMPYKVENSSVDRPQMDLKLEQVLEVFPSYVSASVDNQNHIREETTYNPEDSDTLDFGRLSPNEVKSNLWGV